MRNLFKKFLVLFVFGFVLFGFNSKIFAVSENITQINFTSSPQEIGVNIPSSQLSVQTQNIEGVLEQTSDTNHLNLSSTSSTGEFSSNDTNWLPVNILTMSNGTANKNFYYRDSIPGTYTLTISVEGKSWSQATQSITVVSDPVTLSKIDITTPAIKLNYTVGESLDISGLVVTGTYSDSSTKVETINSSNITGFDSTAPFINQELTINVDGKTTTYFINVAEAEAAPTLSNISITTPATKLNYNVGEVLDISGLVVTGTYSDSSTKVETITASDVTGFDSTAPVNDQTLIITVGGKTTTYNINITEVTGGGSGGGTNQHPSIDGNISLSDNCSINDIAGKTHLFPQEDSPSKFLGICAFVEAKNKAIINSFNVVEYAPFGLFVDSINNIKDPSAYWALYLNDTYEMRGLTTLPLVAGDKVSLVFVDFNNVQIGPRINIHIDSLVLPQTSAQEVSSGGGNIKNSTSSFSIENAIAFLSSQQKDNGSFADFLYTDWAGVAFASINNNSVASQKEKIINYLTTTPLVSDVVTDNERHAITLMSLGVNPYSGTSVNYIKKIVDAFDGVQFGDKDLVNDDIFAIFPLIKAGYTPSDEMIQKDIAFIISKQGSDGSWGSVDITAAAIGALSLLPSSEFITKSKMQAREYLKNAEQVDGGFENSFSTSWALQAIRALDENSLSWVKNNSNPINYLSSKQQSDGGVEPYDTNKNTRIWATSYAITAVQNKSWADVMQSFSKPTSDLMIATKKEIKVPKVKYIKKVEDLGTLENQTPEVSTENNLGASAGNAPVNMSIKNFLKTIGYTTVSTFTYIGKGVIGLINFFAK